MLNTTVYIIRQSVYVIHAQEHGRHSTLSYATMLACNAKSHWITSGFMAPAAGLEPATIRLTVERSAN